jgi:hypothetical protein
MQSSFLCFAWPEVTTHYHAQSEEYKALTAFIPFNFVCCVSLFRICFIPSCVLHFPEIINALSK